MEIPSPRAVKRARIEIIPLIDIIFFLLATFVMVSLSMVKQKGIEVSLPPAITGKEQIREDATVITINEKGGLFFDKESIDRMDLGRRLAALKNLQVDPRVYLNGDEKAPLGLAMAVLDEVRQAGIVKISIATRNPK